MIQDFRLGSGDLQGLPEAAALFEIRRLSAIDYHLEEILKGVDIEKAKDKFRCYVHPNGRQEFVWGTRILLYCDPIRSKVLPARPIVGYSISRPDSGSEEVSMVYA